ncbi:MAG: hypothetical protein B7Z43_09515 [Sphingomonas sp. 12-62-6]|nr:MAG: hypothetical protein B7Z43_09515 [Sphingomonas sp. 12-62-6]
MAVGRVPDSTDLRGAGNVFGGFDPIGPNTLNAILTCVQEVRRRLPQRPKCNSSTLLIQYGQRIIAGTAPIDPPLTRDQQATGLADKAADSDAGLALCVDQPSRSAVATLLTLKASLATGQPFAFLFLQGHDSRSVATPGSRIDGLSPDDGRANAHTAVAVGYDDAQQAFMIIEASPERTPADGNILFLSYAYVTHPVLAQDVWTIRTLNGGA